jgi:hypothetical protein
MRLRLPFLALPLMLAAACAQPTQREPQVGAMQQSSPNRLTSEELRGFATVGQAVQGLRTGWLRHRAGTLHGNTRVWVYRDGMRLGGVEMLANMATGDVSQLEYLDGIRATQRWGLGHENGVIHVISRNMADSP